MARRIPARNDRLPQRQTRRPGRFDRAVPGTVQAPVLVPSAHGVPAAVGPSGPSGQAAAQAATRAARSSPRVSGMGLAGKTEKLELAGRAGDRRSGSGQAMGLSRALINGGADRLA